MFISRRERQVNEGVDGEDVYSLFVAEEYMTWIANM